MTLKTILTQHIKDKEEVYKIVKKVINLLPDEFEVKNGKDGRPLIREHAKIGYNKALHQVKENLGL